MSIQKENVFDMLDPALKGSVARNGIINPTEAQKLAIPEILAGRNTLLISPTGSGKTEAALLPLLNKIYKDNPHQ
ncbi:MAG: ATP-dependent RNA helicase [Ferroplasma sp. Type II]|uniref:DEAD/DEAH box helicase n=1 Tax=Ferroplasma sp. Type II TaxID=261388 RepID=UPI0003896618|nr:DEAD/DEAH box helicase [Ferroplasma sp. Type II]EQB74566.1 MAG: ATP-dependent RNA helicase [Ferroplasma sp. Type II]